MTGLSIIKSRLEQSPIIASIFGKEAEKYILNIISEISKTAGDDKKDLTKCTPDSIVSAIKQAYDLKLEVDGRQHCHLIKYNNKAQLQVGYRGFIYAVKRAYPDANIDCRLVYEGDKFKLSKEGDTTTYTLDVGDPFQKKDKIIGGFCYISYTVGDRLVSFCETMSLEEINKIKGCAKADFIWKSWFEEKAKVAIIKRACKVHFSGIQEVAQIAQFDNKDFDFEGMKDVSNSETITSEQGLELESLAKEKGKDINQINKIFSIPTIIDLPSDKFETLKNTINGNS